MNYYASTNDPGDSAPVLADRLRHTAGASQAYQTPCKATSFTGGLRSYFRNSRGNYWAIIILFFAGCVTSHKTYEAPSDAKVKAAEQTLNEKISIARDSAQKARASTLKAQQSSKNLVVLALAVKTKLDVLASKVPAEFLPLVFDVQTAAALQEKEEVTLHLSLDDAVTWNTKLEGNQKEEETARVQVVVTADGYAGAAAGLAAKATEEREFRIKAESELLRNKIARILWKVCGGGIFIITIAVIVMWKLGKFAIKF